MRTRARHSEILACILPHDNSSRLNEGRAMGTAIYALFGICPAKACRSRGKAKRFSGRRPRSSKTHRATTIEIIKVALGFGFAGASSMMKAGGRRCGAGI